MMLHNTVVQIRLLLGIKAPDKTSSRGHPETVVVAHQSPDSGAFSPSTGAELTTIQSTTRSCIEGDFICADGTCIPKAHHCDHFYDCRDFSDEQYCFG